MDTLPLGSRIGQFPYYLQKRINDGQGGMSEVYLATVGRAADRQSPWVVLKIARLIDQHGEFHHAALDNEVARLRRLKHPGIVRLYPIRREGMPNLPYLAQSDLEGKPWFSVMEYLPGGSLADLIKPEQPLEMGLALEIARGLAATLDYLHSRKQVHLDIKPENILFRSDPAGPRIEPVLIDFGIARDVNQAGLEGGTLRYFPPERLRATQDQTQPPEILPPPPGPQPSMDIYSLGVVLYYMLTGHWPFEGRTYQTLKSAILEGNPTSPSKYQPTLSSELDGLILKAINKDPRQRPTAEELAVALETAAIKLGYEPGWMPETAAQPNRVPILRPGRTINSMRPLLMGLGGVIAAVLVFIGGFIIGGDSSEAATTPVALLTAVATQPAVVETQAVSTPPDISTPAITAEPTAIEIVLPDPTTNNLTDTAEPDNPSTPTDAPKPTLRPTSTGIAPPTKAPFPVVSLVQPPDGQSGSADITFIWRADGPLVAGQFYELIFWKEGQNPLDPAQVRGVAALTTDLQTKINMASLVGQGTLTQGIYFWGIAVAENNPHRRLELLSGGRQFRVD